jgi:iduronate 2-sulfatase|eukprot:COSAG01_NODE_1682_length_9500_cov_7.543666_5_plen_101_part_00
MPRVAWSTYGELRSWTDIVDLDLPHQHLPGWNSNGQPLPNHTFPDATARALRQHYFGAVSYTDEQVGRVLNAVQSNGFALDTITILFGDHGWQLGEHGEW